LKTSRLMCSVLRLQQVSFLMMVLMMMMMVLRRKRKRKVKR